MADPCRIFADADEWRRETLKRIWPELYDAFAGPSATDKPWGCAFAVHYDALAGRIAEYKPVAGRMWLNGPPACVDCLQASDRPGGYPLERVDPREWRK